MDLYLMFFFSYTLVAGMSFTLGYSLKKIRKPPAELELTPEEYGKRMAREQWEHAKKQKRFEAAFDAELKLLQNQPS